MSETKFTRGPWKIVEDRVPSSLEVYGGTIAICECWRRANPETEIANAHLIAAAPELYEALESVGKFLEHSIQLEQSSYDSPPEPASQWDYEAGYILGDLQRVLAKARGEG